MRLSRRLLQKSQEAFLLAVEIYNKPTISYRIENFCYLMANAWELLLKVKLITGATKSSVIFYRKQRKQTRRSLSLRDALVRVFPDEKSPIRRNIEELAIIRDAGTHLCVPELEPICVGLFQAGVINYGNKLREWFGKEALSSGTPPMLSLVIEPLALQPVVLRRRYGREVLEYLSATKERIDSIKGEMNDTKFAVEIEHRFLITKKAGEADIELSSGADGGLRGTILEVPKDPAKTHPYTTYEAVGALNSRLGGIQFSRYDFQAVLHKEKIKNADASDYHYLFKKTGTHMYSERLLELVEKKVRGIPGYLDAARASYKNRNQASRARKAS